MPERRVIANIQWNNKTDRDSFKNNLKTELDKYSHHKRNTTNGESVNSTPNSSVDVIPEASSDADSVYSFIKDKIDNIPAITGTVHKHDCDYWDGGASDKDCGELPSYTEYTA